MLFESKTILNTEQIETLGLRVSRHSILFPKTLSSLRSNAIGVILTDYNGVRHLFTRKTGDSFTYERPLDDN